MPNLKLRINANIFLDRIQDKFSKPDLSMPNWNASDLAGYIEGACKNRSNLFESMVVVSVALHELSKDENITSEEPELGRLIPQVAADAKRLMQHLAETDVERKFIGNFPDGVSPAPLGLIFL